MDHIEYGDGTKEWYLNGKLHREDGPAIEWRDGDKEWWIKGMPKEEEEYNIEMEKRRKLESKYYYKWVDWLFDPTTPRGERVYQRLLGEIVEEVGVFLV